MEKMFFEGKRRDGKIGRRDERRKENMEERERERKKMGTIWEKEEQELERRIRKLE